MNFNEAMQMLGTKLQGKYGHLGFKSVQIRSRRTLRKANDTQAKRQRR